MYWTRLEWQESKWHVLLASKQNIAPPRKAKNGHRVIGLVIKGANMLATSSFMLCCKQSGVGKYMSQNNVLLITVQCPPRHQNNQKCTTACNCRIIKSYVVQIFYNSVTFNSRGTRALNSRFRWKLPFVCSPLAHINIRESNYIKPPKILHQKKGIVVETLRYSRCIE